MRKASKTSMALMLASAFALLTGCGGPFDSTVHGVVTLDGNPLPTGTVTFKPTSNQGSTAYAKVDESGNYELQTGREFGLPPGEYAVTVVARERPTSSYGKDGGPPPAGKQLTPEWYRSPESSGLKFTVESGSNEIDLALTSQAPADWNPQRRRRRR